MSTNRKKFPRSQVPSDKDMKREVACFESNGIFYVKWMDNTAVHMLSNCLYALHTNEVKRKKKGASAKETIQLSLIVKKYNAFMRGVDIMDQRKMTYKFDHRSKIKYYLRVVFDIIDIALNNAFIIYCNSAKRSPLTSNMWIQANCSWKTDRQLLQ